MRRLADYRKGRTESRVWSMRLRRALRGGAEQQRRMQSGERALCLTLMSQGGEMCWGPNPPPFAVP